MKITDAGVGLSPWRRRVLPLLLLGLRAFVAYLLLRPPVELLLRDRLFFSGLAPHWLQYALAAFLVVGGVLFILSPTVVYGALACAAGIGLYEYCWMRVGIGPPGTTLPNAFALLAVLATGEWLSRRVQRRVYRLPQR